MVQTVQKQVEVPQIQYEDEVVHIPVERHVHVPMVQKVQREVQIPQVQYEDQVVEVPIQKQVRVPMVQTVQKSVDIPQVQYVDKVVHIPIQKQVQIPMVETVEKTVEVPQVEAWQVKPGHEIFVQFLLSMIHVSATRSLASVFLFNFLRLDKLDSLRSTWTLTSTSRCRSTGAFQCKCRSRSLWRSMW